MRDGRPVTVEVTADGAGLVSHAGSALLARAADKLAYADETREALGGLLRPGNAGANPAADHITVLDRALEQIPPEYIEQIEILVRTDSAGHARLGRLLPRGKHPVLGRLRADRAGP